LAALVVLTAVLLQTVVISRLGLPYGEPDLVLVAVVALAVADGPGVGMGAGFAGGLLLDLLGDHPLGLVALVLTVVGYAAGRFRGAVGTPDHGMAGALGLVAAGALAGTTGYAVLLLLVGETPLSWTSVATVLPADVGYAVALAVPIVPAVAGLDRRLTGERAG
jgi:rod shape-determining protein MreD